MRNKNIGNKLEILLRSQQYMHANEAWLKNILSDICNAFDMMLIIIAFIFLFAVSSRRCYCWACDSLWYFLTPIFGTAPEILDMEVSGIHEKFFSYLGVLSGRILLRFVIETAYLDSFLS